MSARKVQMCLQTSEGPPFGVGLAIWGGSSTWGTPYVLVREITCIRPPSNKKLFHVYRPGGSKRADWNFFFSSLKKLFFFTFPPVHSSLKKIEIRGGSGNPNLLTGSFCPHPAHRKQFFT